MPRNGDAWFWTQNQFRSLVSKSQNFENFCEVFFEENRDSNATEDLVAVGFRDSEVCGDVGC